MALSFIVCLANIARVHSSCNSEPQHTHTPALIKTIYYNCIILITQMKVCVGFCEWSLESTRIYGMEFHFHTHTRKPMITMNHTELKCLGIRYIFLGPKKVKPSNCSTHFEASEENESVVKSREVSVWTTLTQPNSTCNLGLTDMQWRRIAIGVIERFEKRNMIIITRAHLFRCRALQAMRL